MNASDPETVNAAGGPGSRVSTRDYDSGVTHGTKYAYLKRGCRCEPCRAGWSSYQRQYRAKKPGWNAECNRRRKARRQGNRVGEAFTRESIWVRDGGRCHICKELVEGEWHLEHIIPLAIGGPHAEWNVAVAHPRCNILKGVRILTP